MTTQPLRAAEGVTEALIVETLRRLVACESPSDDLDALDRSARLVADLGTALLGAPPQRIDAEGVPHLRWGTGPTRVLLLAHHDTVWPIGTLERSPFSVEHGVVRGPGCFDMKAGLAMALHALAATGDREGVVLLVTGDEERGSTRSRALIEETAAGATAVLVLEASADGGAWKSERKGVALYEVEFVGRAAHAGLEPERGVNATVELARFVLAVGDLADAGAGTTVTPTRADSGTTTNTVPAGARLAIDVRARTAAELERVDRALRALTPIDPEARIIVRGGINRPPLEARMSAPLVALARRLAVASGLGAVPDVAVGGASDGNFTAGIGVPTLDGLGAVGGGAHADHEHVIAAELAPRTRLLVELIRALSTTEGS